MSSPTRMPRYEIRNDGIGPYALFYCDMCSREYRSQPDVAGNIASDLGRQAASDTLRRIPLFGRAIADNLTGEDPRYVMTLTAPQLKSHWGQVEKYFQECDTCHQIVCLSDFDSQTGFCKEDSPRTAEIAESEGRQAAGVVKGIMDVFGVGDAVRQMSEAAKEASKQVARCPKDGTMAASGTKFCPECGTPMIQPQAAAAKCPQCGAATGAAKFCPECGARVEQAAPAAVNCGACGAELKGAKFCPECGAKAV